MGRVFIREGVRLDVALPLRFLDISINGRREEVVDEGSPVGACNITSKKIFRERCQVIPDCLWSKHNVVPNPTELVAAIAQLRLPICEVD